MSTQLMGALACTDLNPAYRRDAEVEDGLGGDGASNGAPGGSSVRVSCPRSASDLELCIRCEGAVRDESARGYALDHTGVNFNQSPDGLACGVGPNSKVSGALAGLDLAEFTIEAWVFARVLPAAGARMGIIDREDAFGMFLGADGSVSCSIPAGVGVTAPSAVKAGVWTSLTCSLGQNLFVISVNGKAVMTMTANSLTGPATAGSITIGSNNPTGAPLDGAFDNVRIWRRRRTPAEVCEGALACR
ncbi:MAG TPA: LamG domain-containing protein [Polyangia bacterium]